MKYRPIIKFDPALKEAEHFAPLAEKIISGDPQQTVRNYVFAGSGDRFNSGEWTCEPGKWQVRYEANEIEFCHLLEGHIKLTSAEGDEYEFVAGDSFVIPIGFKGTWETLQASRKHYVIVML